jgi:hypothetical protein
MVPWTPGSGKDTITTIAHSVQVWRKALLPMSGFLLPGCVLRDIVQNRTTLVGAAAGECCLTHREVRTQRVAQRPDCSYLLIEFPDLVGEELLDVATFSFVMITPQAPPGFPPVRTQALALV